VEEEEEGRGYHIDIATEAEKERIEENCAKIAVMVKSLVYLIIRDSQAHKFSK
jgi:hypothetical protein